MKDGYPIPFSIPRLSELEKLYNNSPLSDSQELRICFIILTHCHFKSIKSFESRSEEEQGNLFFEAQIYKNNAEKLPDMLKLYIFLNERKMTQDDPLILCTKTKNKITLDNKSNWITDALNEYLEKKLQLESVEEAKSELETLTKRNAGRKLGNRKEADMILTIDNFWRKHTGLTTITNAECLFILRYLDYLGLKKCESEDESFLVDDMKNIRSRIKYLRKENYQIRSLEDFIDANNMRYFF